MPAKLNRLCILCGPSGVGKTTLVQKLAAENPDICVAVTHTTRPPRTEEKNGVHYHFVSKETFEHMIDNGALLEHAEYPPGSGVYYGTSRAESEKAACVVLVVETQGVKNMRQRRPDASTVFLQPPNLDALRRRLAARGKDSPDAISRRLSYAQEEMREGAEICDHVVINKDGPSGLESACQQFLKIVRA